MNLNKILACFAAVILVCIGSFAAAAQETVQENTVRIRVGNSYGSGAYVGERLVLSCAHLYSGESSRATEVWFKDGEKHTGTLLKLDTNWDQSVIELNTKPAKLGIPISSENPKPGELVHAYGYGKQNTIQATTGYVRNYLGNKRDTSAADWFALSGAVQEGSSGGPIVNADGYIIGNLWGTDGYTTVGLCTGRTRRFLLPWRNRLSQGQCRQGICYPPGYQVQPMPQPQQQPPGGLVPLPQAPAPTPQPQQKPPSDLEPLPSQPPVAVPVSPQNKPNCCQPGCNCRPRCIGTKCRFDAQKVADILKTDPDFIAQVKGDKGDPGTDGQDGAPGQDGADGKDGQVSNEQLAAMTAAILQQLKQDQQFIEATKGDPGTDGKDGTPGNDGKDGEPGPPGKDGKDGEQGPPGKDGKDGVDGQDGTTPPLPPGQSETGWSHLVLVAPSESDYWSRLEYDYLRATDYYNQIRHVEPPTDRNIGPMPLLVAYSGGKPAKSWVGLRDVSQALNYIVRGEFDQFMYAENNDTN